MRSEVIERAARPAHGEAQAFASAVAIGGILRALIEGHADVGAERDLYIHRVLGSERVKAAVEMGAKRNSLVADLAQLREAVDLESAGVSEHGPGPADEAMQAAEVANGFMAGPQVEVIGVAENDLRAERLENLLRNRLDRARRSDGHEYGCLDDLMRQIKTASPPTGGGLADQVEGKTHPMILSSEPGSSKRTPCRVAVHPLCLARKMRREATFCRCLRIWRSRIVRRPLLRARITRAWR